MVALARQLEGISTEEELKPVYLALISMEHSGVLYHACHLAKEHIATPLALSEAELRVLSAAVRREIRDGRYSLVSSLARLPVPDFGDDAQLLIRLRREEAAFGSWRDKLGAALSAIDVLPDSADMTEAVDIVRSELDSATADINGAVNRSPALTAAKGGLRRIGVGAISAATTGLMTGNPWVAAAALGASPGLRRC
jgi:hypothetical protein